MATPTYPLSLVLPAANYRDYLSLSDTDNFHGRYAAIPTPSAIDTAAAVNYDALANVARLIYATEQDGVPTAFIWWHKEARGRGAQIDLL